MPRPWVQVELSRGEKGQLKVAVSGDSQGRSTAPQVATGLSLEELGRMGREVQARAGRGAPLTPELKDGARSAYKQVFAGRVGQILDQLRGDRAAAGSVLVRLRCADPELAAIPWEMLRGPDDLDGPVGCHPKLRFARGVHATDPVFPREVRGALRLLVIAPDAEDPAVADMRADLEPALMDGRVEWLEPVLGPAARWSNLYARLSRLSPRPHVIHLICHGRVGAGGEPELLLDPAEDLWTAASTLATALSANLGDELRLVVLEACQGAQPGALASAAEHLAARGVDAVLAFLWPVRVGAARTVARTFYDALTESAAGDVATSVNAARLALEGLGTAEHLCPVLVLRGNDAEIFDLTQRRLQPQQPGIASGHADPRVAALRAKLARRLGQPGTLLLGPLVGAEGGIARPQLEREVEARLDLEVRESLSALLQRFEFQANREELRAMVQQVFADLGEQDFQDARDLITGIASLGGRGLYITLLWLPLLEEALASAFPALDVLVLQPLRPGEVERMHAFLRSATTGRWQRLAGQPAALDMEQMIVVLRLFGGNSHQGIPVGNPVLTDDDQLQAIAGIGGLQSQILGFLRNHPLHVVGISPLDWAHREILRKLLGGQPMVADSLVVLSERPSEAERSYWISEDGPAGRGGGVELLGYEDVLAAVRA